MILIADSGSTKTDWALAEENTKTAAGPVCTLLHTQGINPFHQSEETVRTILRDELLPQLSSQDVTAVSFYGSGVRPELETYMENLLSEVLHVSGRVEARGDMLGAARALCGRNYGIASILGTGANSCLYDGERIVGNTPALGYILGDEGSGAVLGRRLVNGLYKGVLSKELKGAFEDEMQLTMAAVIDRVYRQPMANRFLASLCLFIGRHIDDEQLQALVIDNFRDFFKLNIAPYRRADLPVSFVGSIAWHFRAQLAEAAGREGYIVGQVVQSPIDGLVRYALGQS